MEIKTAIQTKVNCDKCSLPVNICYTIKKKMIIEFVNQVIDCFKCN